MQEHQTAYSTNDKLLSDMGKGSKDSPPATGKRAKAKAIGKATAGN